jgi:hypothetical protein
VKGRIAAVALFSLLTAVASGEGASEPEPGESFVLALGESASLRGENLSVRFVSMLEDSRCPRDVQCIRAGNAGIRLEISRGSASPATVELATPEGPREAEVDGFRLALEAGVLHLTSPQITIPASATNARLTFVHWVATEGAVDGGNLRISVNGGPWQLVLPGDFIYNAYTGNLLPAAAPNTNPMAGQPAWSGSDGGSVLGTWGRSIVNLSPYAKAKDKIRLRFDFGTDCGTGFFGWYLDDVSVYRCN